MSVVGVSYKAFDDRVFKHSGVVIDIGCLNWDWSDVFFGKKQVIGYDPLEETCPKGAVLHKKMVTIYNGTARINRIHDNIESTTCMPRPGESTVEDRGTVETVSINDVLQRYPSISLLKMNIEGAEYAVLTACKHPIADQLVVAFHDNSWTRSDTADPLLTKCIIQYLSKWYNVVEIYSHTQWYLFISKEGDYV